MKKIVLIIMLCLFPTLAFAEVQLAWLFSPDMAPDCDAQATKNLVLHQLYNYDNLKETVAHDMRVICQSRRNYSGDSFLDQSDIVAANNFAACISDGSTLFQGGVIKVEDRATLMLNEIRTVDKNTNTRGYTCMANLSISLKYSLPNAPKTYSYRVKYTSELADHGTKHYVEVTLQ